MLINEIFFSIQGEGKLAGVPSTFIRTSGCNLRCTWCDTPLTSWDPQGTERPIDDILEEVARHRAAHVVLTGGEPMIAADVESLCQRLRESGYHLTIETAGTVWKDVTCDLASISPKLANSTPDASAHPAWSQRHENARINLDTIRRFMRMPDYQLKFVVDEPTDIDEIEILIDAIGDCRRTNVLLMPQGVTQSELDDRKHWIGELCKERGFRFCPRLHIELYGHTPGT